MKLTKWLFIICFMGVVFSMNGQSETNSFGEEDERAKKVIKEIKMGTLVVILSSNANKIEELTRILKSNSLNKNQYLRLKNELFETVARIDRQNGYLLDFFIKHYDFSALRFVYDTSLVHLNSGTTKNIFVNKNLVIDEKIELTSPVGGFIKIGKANKQGTGISALLVSDKSGAVMNSPFPYNIVLPDDKSEESEKFFFEQIIEKTDIRLKNYYEKVYIYRGE